MDSAFYELFEQIGSTAISIVFSFFVGYLLYIKRQRDGICKDISSLKRKIFSVIEQLRETPIPGVVQSLVSSPEDVRTEDRLSIVEWTSGTSWEMRVEAGQVNDRKIWDAVRMSLENLVRSLLPHESIALEIEQTAKTGYFAPKFKIISESFRKCTTDFLVNTEHIEWFTHEYAGYSRANSFLRKMKAWEIGHGNPVLKSEDVSLMFARIMTLRRLVLEDLLLEDKYESLRIENLISSYKIIIGGFFAMGFFSVFIPLMVLLFPPIDNQYRIFIGEHLVSINVIYLSFPSLLGFILAWALVMILLMKTARRET